MSAPRKIWANPEHIWSNFDDSKIRYSPSEVYHHDDVVRELVSIAGQALDEWESCIDSEYSGTSSYGEMIADVHDKRASLAKIGREDQ